MEPDEQEVGTTDAAPENDADRAARIRRNIARFKMGIAKKTNTREQLDHYLTTEKVTPPQDDKRTFGDTAEDVRSVFLKGVPLGNRARAGFEGMAALAGIPGNEMPEQSLASQKARIAQMEATHPLTSMALEMTSGSALPLGPLKNAAAGSKFLARVAPAVGNLVLGGAAQGANAADLSDGNVGTGATSGAATALGVGGVLHGLGAAGGKIAGAVSKRGGQKQAMQQIDDLTASTGTLAALRDALTTRRAAGGDPMAFEMLGDRGESALRAATNAPLSSGGKIARDAFAERSGRVLPRSESAVREATGIGKLGPERVVDEMEAYRIQNAAPLLQMARREAGAIEAAPAEAASRMAAMERQAGQKALPAPGQSAVAKAGLENDLANVVATQDYTPETIYKMTRGKRGLGRTRDVLEDVARALESDPTLSVEEALTSAMDTDAARDAHYAGKHIIRAARMLGVPESRAAEMLKFDFEPLPRVTGTPKTLEQAAAYDFTAPNKPFPSAAEQPIQSTRPGEPNYRELNYTKPRPVEVKAANDVNVRRAAGADIVPPTQGPDVANRFAQQEEAGRIALDDPHVQMQLKSLYGQDSRLAQQDPSSYPVLEKMYREMNREWRQLKARGEDTGQYWHALNTARGKVNTALDAKSPEFSKFNKQWSGDSKELESYALGRGFRDNSPETIAKMLGVGKTVEGYDVIPEAFRAGVAQDLLGLLQSKSASPSLAGVASAKNPLGALNNAQLDQKLAAALGDKYRTMIPTFREILREEAAKQRVMGGSNTARKLADETGDPILGTLGAMASAAGGGLGFGAEAAVRRGLIGGAKQAFERSGMGNVGKMATARASALTSRGPELDALLQSLEQRRATNSVLRPTAVPVGNRGLLAYLSNLVGGNASTDNRQRQP
jgi:hypothetical protein